MSYIDDLLEFEDSEAEKPRDVYVRAPFSWPGNKFNSLDEIIPLLPPGDRFIEPCGGSGVVTLNLVNKYKLMVFNDRHSGITAFFRCVKDKAKKDKILEWLNLSLHSREEFIWCRDSWENCQDDVERAARWYYMLRTSFSHLGRNWGRATGGAAQIGKKLYNNLDLIDVAHRRLRDVQIENLDAIQCVKDYAGAGAVFYCDPDYIGTDTGIYQHGVEHKRLLETVFASKGWFAVSSYRNELYDSYDWDQRFEWEIADKMRARVFNESNNLKGKQNVMAHHGLVKECLYVKDLR